MSWEKLEILSPGLGSPAEIFAPTHPSTLRFVENKALECISIYPQPLRNPPGNSEATLRDNRDMDWNR